MLDIHFIINHPKTYQLKTTTIIIYSLWGQDPGFGLAGSSVLGSFIRLQFAFN